jgi:uncharacterized protein (TIGR02391 family)
VIEHPLSDAALVPTVARLHPAVVRSSYRLFVNSHLSEAIFEAYKAVDVRVSAQSRITDSGRGLMAEALKADGPIQLAHEVGQSGDDEQEGFKLLFMGASQGIRNPKAHSFARRPSPQRTVEYLSLASLMFHRLDDAIHEIVRSDRTAGREVVNQVEEALPGSVQARIEGVIGYPSTGVPPTTLVLYGGPAPGKGQLLRTARSVRKVPFVFDSVLPGSHRLIAYVEFRDGTLIGSTSNDAKSQWFDLDPGGVMTDAAIDSWKDADRAELIYEAREPPTTIEPGYELLI